MGKHTSIGGLGELERKLDKIANAKPSVEGVKVGIVESARYPLETQQGRPNRKKSEYIAQVALWNEFGTKGGGWGGPIPERPFMRNSAAKFSKDKRVQYMIKQGINVADPSDITRNAGILGEMLKGIMQEEITDGNFKPNAPATIAIKTKGKGGKTTPLIDEGYLRRAIDYEIIRFNDKKPQQTSFTGEGFGGKR